MLIKYSSCCYNTIYETSKNYFKYTNSKYNVNSRFNENKIYQQNSKQYSLVLNAFSSLDNSIINYFLGLTNHLRLI